MNLGSLYASFGIDMSSTKKDVKEAEAIFGQLGTSIANISEEMEETLIKTFRQKFPDAFNTMQNKFVGLQDETKSFIEYIQSAMPGAFQKVVAEVNGMSTQVTSDFQESNAALDGMAGTVQIVKDAMSQMSTASERRKALLDEEVQSLIELQLRKQAAYDPEDILKYENEIKNVQKRINLLAVETSEFKDVSVMSLGEMKKELRSLRNTPLELASPEHMASVKARMAELTDAVGDYGKQLRAQGDTTQRFIMSVQGIVGVVQGVTGTLALFGVQSENVEKTMLAFMNVSQALGTIHDLNEKGILRNIAAKVKDIFITNQETAAIVAQTAALKANQGAQNFATKSPGVGASNASYGVQAATGFKVMDTGAKAAAGGVKVLGAAMKALPLVGVIAGLVGLAYALESLDTTSEELAISQTNWNNAMKDNQALKDNKKIYDDLKISLRDLGLEYDVLMGKMTANQAQGVKDTQTAEEEKAKIRGNFVSYQMDEEKKRNDLLTKMEADYQDAVYKARTSKNTAGLKSLKQHEAEKQQIIDASNKRIETERTKSWQLRAQVDEKFAKMQAIRDAEEAKQKAQQQQQAWEQYAATLKSWQQKIQDMQDDMIANDEEREIAKLERRRQREMADLTASGLAVSERGKMETIITEYYEKEQQKIRDKYSKEAAEKRKGAMAKMKEAMIAGMTEANNAIQERMEKQADEENKLWTLRANNSQLSAQERIAALLRLEDMRYAEEQKKYKDNALIMEQLAQEHANNIKNINTGITELTGQINWAEKWKEASQQVIEATSAAAQSVITGLAEMVGEGTFTAENFGKLVLSTLADLAIQVGKIAIATGLAVEGIKEALMSLNPAVAVMAGAALVALGTWAKSALSNAAQGSATPENPQMMGVYGGSGGMMGLATGGEVLKAGSFLVGEEGPEILNLPGRAKVLPNSALDGGPMQLIGRISGRDLEIVLQRAQSQSGRR